MPSPLDRIGAGRRLGGNGERRCGWERAAFRAMSITAIVGNDTIKPPMHMLDGTKGGIKLPEMPAMPDTGGNASNRLLEFAGCIDDFPKDFAAEHDRSIHGTPKGTGIPASAHIAQKCGAEGPAGC